MVYGTAILSPAQNGEPVILPVVIVGPPPLVPCRTISSTEKDGSVPPLPLLDQLKPIFTFGLLSAVAGRLIGVIAFQIPPSVEEHPPGVVLAMASICDQVV